MSLLELAVTFIKCYCEKHVSCAGCRLNSDGTCQIQDISFPPEDWDIETMIKGEKKK